MTRDRQVERHGKDARYPIGRFEVPESPNRSQRTAWLEALEHAPGLLRDAVAGLSEAQLDTPYRAGGWTVRQVIHHVADSHMNSYARFKLALTEDTPTIKAYSQDAWVELPDASTPVGVSLDLIEALHARWSTLLAGLDDEQWARGFIHPESGSTITLERNLALYAWHGRHHAAQIMDLRVRNGW